MEQIRVVEIGGTHIRRAEIENNQITRLQRHRTREILNSDIIKNLKDFSLAQLPSENQAIIYLVAGPTKDSTVLKMPNFPEFPCGIDLKKSLNLNQTVLVYNDMIAATVGMAELLAQEGIEEPFWGITWSTGLGGKFWDGDKIGVDREIGHEIFVRQTEAEKLLGGRFLTEEAGKPLEIVTSQFIQGNQKARQFYLEKAEIMGEFLMELIILAPSNLFVFKGSIAKNIFINDEIRQMVIEKMTQKEQKIKLLLSPDPEKDSFVGAYILAKKALSL